MKCKNCKKSMSRTEENATEICSVCQSKATQQKVTNDLLTAFGGKGRRGFVQWLKFGKFLQPIADDQELCWYNDRIQVIEALVGPAKLDRLIGEFSKVVLEIAKEETAKDE